MPIQQRLSAQLTADTCPHCEVAAPVLNRVWQSDGPTKRNDGEPRQVWAAFVCTTCGCITSASGNPNETVANPTISKLYPETWNASESIPNRARTYLNQARRTLANPDASVVMSASAIDAMLKDKELAEGSLYARIEQAVERGIITAGMAMWAHRVRLDANNPRHADDNDPHMSRADADRAFEFAKTLAEILYVLPSRMPIDQIAG